MPTPITAYESYEFEGPLYAPAKEGNGGEAEGSAPGRGGKLHRFRRPIYSRAPLKGTGGDRPGAETDDDPNAPSPALQPKAPPVVVIQELPGIGQETLHLCDELVEAGFHVYLPHLFGPIGRQSFVGNTARVFCMRREFTLFEKNASSPIVNWLRALCVDVRAKTGAKGVGTIGMCLTGNFAISLMADDAVLAGVAAQPSMPFGGHAHLHMSADDVAEVKTKLDEVGPMLGYRFDKDPICQGAKFKALDEAFNQDKERIRLRTLPGKGHSVLTGHFVDEAGHPTREALDEVIGYFKGALA